MKHIAWPLLVVLPLLLLAGIPASADTPPPTSANVIMTDTGFNPPGVTIQPGGSVTWVNQGQNVHTATSIGGSPLPFNTGGIGPGQSTSLSFGIPGQYWYTSSTDCLGGSIPSFPCQGSFLITVTNAQVQATSAAATQVSLPATYTPTATAVPTNLAPQFVTVNITDTGFDQPAVTVALGGQVQFVNIGKNVHSATSLGTTTWQGFDSGGLGNGQIFQFTFAQAGTYSVNSAPDCLNGNLTAGYNCNGVTVTVSTQALPQAIATPTPGNTPVPVLAAPNPNTTVVLDDVGYHPFVLNVKSGQTVTWVHKGTQVHTVTSDQGYTPAFDSGGLNPNQTFTWTFTTPGSFNYHSQTEPQYFTDTNCNCTQVIYAIRGTINVSP